jgi:hypothetical protein
MIPIFEQGSGKGIGLNFDDFETRFNEICDKHVKTGRAKAFAFIFYNFTDDDLKRILRDQGVFTRLDQLAGEQLSIFFLHCSSSKKAVDKFQNVFFDELGIKSPAVPPCVVFFKLRKNQIADLYVARLNSADVVHGFHELYETIREYIAGNITTAPKKNRYITWVGSSVKFVSIEAFKITLKIGLDAIKESLFGG